MINAIKDITVAEGIDPSETVIVAGGGAAGLNIVPIARELACRAVIVPRTASVLSACGMQFSDIQAEHSATVPTRSGAFDRAAVNQALGAIDAVLGRFAATLARRGFERASVSYRVDAHYAAQVWDIAVELPAPRIASDEREMALVEAFHAAHRRIFSVEDRASPIEFLNWTGRLSVELPQAPIRTTGGPGDAARDRRAVWFDLDDRREADVVRGDDVAVGQRVAGPAIIEEATTTLVLPPRTRAVLTPSDGYVVELSV
jgi:N-methylhydantoinase A